MFVLILGATTILWALVWYVTFRKRRRSLYELADKLPGPPQLPFIGHLHRFMGDTEDLNKTLQNMSRIANDYGGISKFWVGHLLFCLFTNPVDIEYVLKTYLDKDGSSRFIRKVTGNGIIFAPASIWRRRRKIMTTGFSTRNLDQFFELFRGNSELLAEQLQSRVGVAGEFDLWPYISGYTLDSVIETIFDTETTVKDSDYLQMLSDFAQVFRLISERFFCPWLHPDWLYWFSSSYTTFHQSRDYIYSFVDKLVNRTRLNIMKKELEESKADVVGVDEPRKWTSFVSLLIEQSRKSISYSNEELREEAMSLTAAGTDTTAVGISFTLLLLARHQDVQERVYQELMDVFGKSDRPLEKEDLSKLCYLEQVIKESLRLYPPVPLISRKTDKEITLPSGAVLPADGGILISIWGVHRNPAYWGADVEQFRPERFSPERYNPQHACVYMPFSAGPRNCIAYQYAMSSMKTALATVLRKYRVRLAGDPSAHIRVKYEITTKPVEGFKVLLEQRD